MPTKVLIKEIPSAPAASTALAIVVISVTFGVNLTKIGTELASLTAFVTAAATEGSVPNAMPPWSTFGHEMLTSSAFTFGAALNFLATAVYSATSAPAMLAIIGKSG